MASQHQQKERTARFAVRPRPWVAVLALVLAGAAVWIGLALRFPPDTTPEGAYLRIAYAMNSNRPQACFAYLEEEAQHAAFSIGDYAKRIDELIVAGYPPKEQMAARQPYQAIRAASRGPGIWVVLARERGWLTRLNQDLSGVKHLEVHGDRATIVTVRGTRYTFKRRPNKIWGLTTFTAELMAETEKLARDEEEVKRATRDFERVAP